MTLHLRVLVYAQESGAEPPKGAKHGSQERPADPEDNTTSRNLPGLLEAKPLKVSPTDDELVKLLKSRHNVAVKELQLVMTSYIRRRTLRARGHEVAARIS